MMKLRNFFLFLLATIFTEPAFAKLSVIATTTDLRAIAEEIGGADVSVDGITKGTQDPHYVEAKPSFMVKASRVDLLIAIGMELEIGWLPNIIQGARNPKINSGMPGYLEVGPLVTPLEVPHGDLTRADGDVHPFGNPHVTLDPIRAGEIAVHIAKRMGELDPSHQNEFNSRAQTLQKRLIEKTKSWKAKIQKSGIKQVISYHKTLTYFFDRFGIENPAILEPKPGIPPTSAHVIDVIKLIKAKSIRLILVENYFDPTVTQKILQEIPTVKSATVAVSVDGGPGINKIDDLYESLVNVF